MSIRPFAGFPKPGRVSLLLLLIASVFASGCAIKPRALVKAELVNANQADRLAARRGMPPIDAAITLDEAIARALKYNLDHRTRLMEQAFASGQFDVSRFDMLPRMLVDAGYAWRDQDSTRRATDAVTGLPSLANPYISSERSHATADIGLTWSVLDFGASYYTARQNADQLMITGERRRKAMHGLIQNVRTAFWRAAAAEKLSDQVRATVDQAELALNDSRKVADERIKSPAEALRYQRNVLENLRLLENVDRELSSARIELASLIGADPGSRFGLAEPVDDQPMPMDLSLADMEDIALTRNADLREQHYNARIAATETRKALIRLLPGISFDYRYRHDSDSYLVHRQWQDAGVQVSYNLFNLLSAPSRMAAARMGEAVAQTRRMALQMTVLTQVHLANFQYEDALRQYRRSEAIYEVDSRLAQLAISQEQSQMASRLDRISSDVTFILSSVRRYHAMAKVHEAASRVQATLGLEPEIGNLDDIDLPTLQQQIRQSMQRWASVHASPRGAARLLDDSRDMISGGEVVARQSDR